MLENEIFFRPRDCAGPFGQLRLGDDRPRLAPLRSFVGDDDAEREGLRWLACLYDTRERIDSCDFYVFNNTLRQFGGGRRFDAPGFQLDCF
jgi:hypothetical protein